jgi:translation initiation factor eIF-2B subunit epsilon
VGEESEDEEEDGQNALGHLACRDFSALTLGDTSDSDMSSESSDDGEEDATLAESAFAKELAQTIERAFAENHTVDVAALELNTLRMAYDADYDTIREAVIKALLDEIKAKNAVKTLLGRWSNLVLRMIHSKKDQLHALAIISDHCSGDAVLRKVYPQVLHQLYDQDVLEEGILLWWHAQPSPSPADQAMKALATPLITWLKEADEDSGSEDE